MDGIHDLGGRHGFGKIEIEQGDEQFHADWELRARCLINAMCRAPDWNLDWFRHCRELIDPVDYLSRPYLDQWIQTYCAMLVNSGWASIEELASGKSAGDAPVPPKPPMTAAQVKAAPMRAIRFDKEIDQPPLFAVGETVRATHHTSERHTRMPTYARGHLGRVITHHGAHVYPDDNALNRKRHEHLYTVEFEAGELWPEAAGSTDSISLDLWESYLESA